MSQVCKECGSGDIVYETYYWAYDGPIAVHCYKCNTRVHLASWQIVLKQEQKENYGPIIFFLANWEVAVNNRIIWNEQV